MNLDGVTPSQDQTPVNAHPGRVLVAYSGGPDSTALLHLVCAWRDQGQRTATDIHAVYVNHRLQRVADGWEAHCAAQCAAWNVHLHVCRVDVDPRRGTEDGAREARYAALARIARDLGVAHVLTGHHLDDRLETFWLQWLRGAGPQGLAGGVSLKRQATPGVQIVRPLLDIGRDQIEAYLARHALTPVLDPSNADPRFDRNALRLTVMPALAKIRSGYRRAGARAIDLIGEAADVLYEVGEEGLAWCTEDAPAGMLRVERLAALSPARQPIVLRAWLASHLADDATPGPRALHLPSRARLREILHQAFSPDGDGSMLVRLGHLELRRYRGYLGLRPAAEHPDPAQVSVPFVWHGEAERVIPGWDGVLRFQTSDTDAGLDPVWLAALPLDLRARTGGERFKPHALRPSKTLKHWFQEAAIPEFDRPGLPLLWRGDRLVFVGGLGTDARLTGKGPGRIVLRWEPSQRLSGT
jgi:tRNA(Ile)-lysidine synthase